MGSKRSSTRKKPATETTKSRFLRGNEATRIVCDVSERSNRSLRTGLSFESGPQVGLGRDSRCGSFCRQRARACVQHGRGLCRSSSDACNSSSDASHLSTFCYKDRSPRGRERSGRFSILLFGPSWAKPVQSGFSDRVSESMLASSQHLNFAGVRSSKMACSATCKQYLKELPKVEQHMHIGELFSSHHRSNTEVRLVRSQLATLPFLSFDCCLRCIASMKREVSSLDCCSGWQRPIRSSSTNPCSPASKRSKSDIVISLRSTTFWHTTMLPWLL